MKKTILFFVLLFLTIGAYGCNMKAQEKRDSMIIYINNKYTDDKFTFVSVTGGHWGSNTSKIIVSSKNYPEKKIRVVCSEDDGKLIYSDNYLNIKYEKETYEYIKNTLVSCFGDNIYLQYIPSDATSCDKGSGDTTFEEYISSSDTYVYFSAVVIESSKDEDEILSKIKEIFRDSVVRAHIFFVDKKTSLENNGAKIIEEKSFNKSLFIVKDSINNYKTVEWMAGYESK